jgi:hypothetical protein
MQDGGLINFFLERMYLKQSPPIAPFFSHILETTEANQERKKITHNYSQESNQKQTRIPGNI